MASEALYRNEAGAVKATAAAAHVSAEVVQLPDGRAGVYEGQATATSGDVKSYRTSGHFAIKKSTSVSFLPGCRVYWDASASQAVVVPGNGDFYLGIAVDDAAAADTTVRVDLNCPPKADWTLQGPCLGAATLLETNCNAYGQGIVTRPGGEVHLVFDTTSEAATASIEAEGSGGEQIVSEKYIFEAIVEVQDDGDAAALDFNIGIASDGHATDADSIAESVFFHLDGNDLNIFAESDDGTTEVAATDTTKDLVLNTPFHLWIDARTRSDIQLYVDGVNVLPNSTFTLAAATGPLKALVHLEKTTSTTGAHYKILDMRVRRVDAE